MTLLLAACATPSSSVLVASADDMATCQFLTSVEGSYSTDMLGDPTGKVAFNRTRARARDAGATHMVITERSSEGGIAAFKADAYRC